MVFLDFPRPKWDTGLVRWYRSARMGQGFVKVSVTARD